MRIGKNNDPLAEEEEGRKIIERPKKRKVNENPFKEVGEKEPYRWVTAILFLLIVFVTYIFWVAGS